MSQIEAVKSQQLTNAIIIVYIIFVSIDTHAIQTVNNICFYNRFYLHLHFISLPGLNKENV